MVKERGVEDVVRQEAVVADDEIGRLIEEAEESIRNTRSFLEHLRLSEEKAREYVDSIRQRFENELQYLQRRCDAESNSHLAESPKTNPWHPRMNERSGTASHR